MKLLALALWLAILTAWGEQGLDYFNRIYRPGLSGWSPFAVWMTMTMDAALFLLLYGVSRLLSWRRPGEAAGVHLLFFGAWLSLAFRFYPLLHPLALLLLAAGLARQSAVWMLGHREWCARVVRRSAAVLAVSVAGALFACYGSDRVTLAWRHHNAPPPPAQADNVLWIVLDTVRAQDLQLYGYPRKTTPLLTKLAAGGVVFDHAVSTAPWTLPSHASMFTGHYPQELSADWHRALDSSYPTIAEYFRDHGYETAGIVANVGFCHRYFGLDRGFEWWDDYPLLTFYEFSMTQSLSHAWLTGDVGSADDDGAYHDTRYAPIIDRAALQWLARRPARPFFLFLNYMDAHWEYNAPRFMDHMFEADRPGLSSAQWHRNHYDAAIAYLDLELYSLLHALSTQGLLDHTLVIITADHGEQLGEHGLFSHGNSLYGQLLDVPLILIYPGHVPTGQRVKEVVSLRDLPATVVDLMRMQGASPFPGRSLATCWQAASGATAPSPALSHLDFFRHAIDSLTAGSMHYIYDQTSGQQMLFDTAADADELHDLAPERRDDANACRARLTALLPRTH